MAGRLAGDVVLPHQVIARFEVVGVTLDVEKGALEALEPKLVFSILLEKVGTHLRSALRHLAVGIVPASHAGLPREMLGPSPGITAALSR